MADIINQQYLDSKKEKVDRSKMPEVQTYANFENILLNIERKGNYTPVNSLSEIIVKGDNEGVPKEKRIYSIYKIQQTNNGTVEVPLCYIVGEAKTENFITKYSRKNIDQFKNMITIDIEENQEKIDIIMNTQDELAGLKDVQTEFEFDEEGKKEFFKIAEELTKEVKLNYSSSQKTIETRLKNRKKPTILETNMLELLKHKSTKDLGNIQQIEDTLKRLKKDDKKDINADTRQRSTSNMLLELLHYKDQSIRLRTVIDNESTMKNFVDNPALLMDIPIESSQDAVFVENVYSKIRVERLLINNHTASAALQAITDRNGQTLHDYLMHSISHGTNEKFMPSIELESQFIEVKKTYPEIVKFLGQTEGPLSTNTENTNTSPNNIAGVHIDANPVDITQNRRSNGGLIDRMLPGFANDIIDDTNRSPELKQRAKKTAGFLTLLGAGFLAFKTIKNIFSSKEKRDKNRGRYAAGLGFLVGTSYLTSGNLVDMRQIGKGIGSRRSSSPDNMPSNKKEASPETITTDALAGIQMIFQGMSAQEVGTLVIQENGETKIDYDKAILAIEINKARFSNADKRIQTLKSFKAHNNPKILSLGFKALNINKARLEKNPNESFDALTEKGLINFIKIAEFMEKGGKQNKGAYDTRNPDLTNEIYKFMRGEGGSLEELEAMGAFEKLQDPQENTAIKTNIEALQSIQNKKELYKQALKVSEELNSKNDYKGTFEFVEKNGQLYLKTYGQETAIDLEKKSIGNISLYTTYQTLKAANLTNRLKDLFQGKSDIADPFNISAVGGDIEFQKNKLASTEGRKRPWEYVKSKFDTTAVSAGKRGSLEQIAPTLEKQKEAYKNYLNSLPGWKK